MPFAARTRHPIVTADLETILATELPWSCFAGKTVLITGAYGFLPAYMAETLLYLNEQMSQPAVQVIGLVRNEAKAWARFAHYQGRPDFQLLVQDVIAPVSYPGEIDYIVHAASKASPKYYSTEAADIIGANVFGTHNMLSLALEKRATNMLFFSTAEVYGESGDGRTPIKEDQFGPLDPAQVRACYPESKRLGETMCVAWSNRYGLPVSIVRPFHTYGPGMDLEDGRVFADFVGDIVFGRHITLRSDGRSRRAFCYNADAAAGLFTLLLKGQTGHAYNLGNPEGEISIGELADLLVNMFPERKLQVVRSESTDDRYLRNPATRVCPDIGKIMQLGWRPTTGVAEGFRRTVLSYESV